MLRSSLALSLQLCNAHSMHFRGVSSRTSAGIHFDLSHTPTTADSPACARVEGLLVDLPEGLTLDLSRGGGRSGAAGARHVSDGGRVVGITAHCYLVLILWLAWMVENGSVSPCRQAPTSPREKRVQIEWPLTPRRPAREAGRLTHMTTARRYTPEIIIFG